MASNTNLGAPIGSSDYVHSFVSKKINSWIDEISVLSDIALSQPHAALAGFTHGMIHKFTYLCRTTPSIDHLLFPLEELIRSRLIPAVCNQPPPNDLVRDLLGLPPRLGGIGLPNPSCQSTAAFSSSVRITAPLVNLIHAQCFCYPPECTEAQLSAKKEASLQRKHCERNLADSIQSLAPPQLQKAIVLAQESGASSWLSTLPLNEYKFSLHKRALHDALALRYGWPLSNIPSHCACGALFSVEHELSCPKGGFTILRHNEIRDLTANVLSEVCHNVNVEPALQPLSGEVLTGASAIRDDAARLDIAADGFWGDHRERVFCDVRIFQSSSSF